MYTQTPPLSLRSSSPFPGPGRKGSRWHVGHIAQTVEDPPCGKCRLQAKGTGVTATDVEPAMLLVWFPELGSKMPGSQAGNLCQAKQAISTYRNPAAQ